MNKWTMESVRALEAKLTAAERMEVVAALKCSGWEQAPSLPLAVAGAAFAEKLADRESQ